MAKEGLTPIFRCEAAKQGKLDARRSSTTSSVAPEGLPQSGTSTEGLELQLKGREWATGEGG